MNNAEWMVKSGYDFTKLGIALNGEESFESYSYKIFLDKTHIATIITNDIAPLKAMLLWLNQKHAEMILTDAERRYLKDVIRPFRYRVKGIQKYESDSNGNDFISISFIDSPDIDFPNFTRGTMYTGMAIGKEYTLEELGL